MDREHVGPLSDEASPPSSQPRHDASEESPADLGEVFVGRQRELARLEAALQTTRAGAGRLALLVGEPGIGKTRTALEFAHLARRAGALVLGGRCYEGGGTPAFWPWMQILRGCIARLDGDPEDLAPHVAALAHVLPGPYERSFRGSDPSASASAATRFRFFDTVCTLLRALAVRQPVVLVLEDSHCADAASLQLLTFLGRELVDTPVLVIVTYRDTEVGRGHPLVDAIVETGRHHDVLRVLLSGLSETEVAQLLGLVIGRAAAVNLVRVMHRLTDGNPFFVMELMRLLIDESCLHDWEPLLANRVVVPRSVRDVIRHRRAGLTAACDELLVAAAVIGRDFEVPVLERVCHRPAESVLGFVEEAVGRGLVVSVPERPGGFRFAHALIREAVYDDVGQAARCTWHRRVGDALEALQAKRDEPRWGEVAYHYAQCALTAGSTEVRKAIEYAHAAGRQALALLAYEDAAQHFESALRLIDGMTPVEPGRRETSCDVLLALGDAYQRAGQPERAREGFHRAAALARAATLPTHFARAALGFAGPLLPFGSSEQLTRPVLEEALRVLPDDDSTLRAQALSRLAFELRAPAERARRARLSDGALAMGRRLGDPRTLSLVLSERRVRLNRSAGLRDRLAEDDELIRLAQDDRDVEAELQGRGWRVLDLLEFGAIAAVDEEIRAFTALASPLRYPLYLHRVLAFRTTRAILDGDLDTAEALAPEFFAMACRVSEFQALAAFSAQAAMLRRLRGGLAELLPTVEHLVEQNPALAPARAGLALLYAEIGRTDDARREFERLAVGDFGDLPDDYFWPATVAYLAELAASLGDTVRARLLYDLLLPIADRTIVLGVGGCWGSAARFLGIVASTMRRWEVAIRHFEEALAMNRRLGARSFIVLTEQAYAAALLERGGPGDRERACELIASAARAARQLGMRSALEATLDLSRRADRSTPVGAAAPDGDRLRGRNGHNGAPTIDLDAARAGLLFRRDGEFFCIGAPPTAFRLKDSLGLRYLAQLLAYPRRTFLALDLTAAVQDRESPPAWEGRGDVMLDERARAAYRTRLVELGQELDEATAQNDEGRAARLRTETEMLTEELVRSTGLGGRGRRIAGPLERARVNVTRTIRDAIRRITAHDAAIGRHLAANVRTGTYCAYDPGLASIIHWLG